jgi:hypothetical protein
MRAELLAWTGSLSVGAFAGLALAAALHLGLTPELHEALRAAPGELQRAVGPVWVPMALVAARVLWLAVRALRTRRGRGDLGRPVRPELLQLAPLFAAFGLAGTVWGLSRAFDALEGGEFLTRLPTLLGGLGAAMTSTLVGLGLQTSTLLVAAFNPAWSRVRVNGEGAELRLELDGLGLGHGLPALAALLAALDARAPEALRVEYEGGVATRARERLRAALLLHTDAAIALREVES